MAALKVYTFHPYTVYDERVSNILSLPRQQLRYTVFVAARSKAAAVEFCKQARCSDPRESELRLACDVLGDALWEASLLNEEGVVLVTADRGGEKPLVLMGTEEGAQAIGVVRPIGLGSRYVFEACRAAYAGIGSVAVGKRRAYVKDDLGYPEGVRWAGTNGDEMTDHEMQRLIDLNEVEIIRSGFGKWA